MNHNIVEVISPATACSNNEILEIKKFLNQNRFVANIFLENELSLYQKPNHEFPSFSAKLRFEQLRLALENPNSNIIWCTRGGYGSAELLPFLYKTPKPKIKKTFIGFSDISAINNFLIQEWGWEVISAPVLVQLVFHKVSLESRKAILDLLGGKISEVKYELVNITAQTGFVSPSGRLLDVAAQHKPAGGITNPARAFGEFSSTIIGGCLSVLCNHFATKNQIDWQNKILFLEDEGEDGERLDRYLHQLITIMFEQQNFPSAILLGNFLESNPHGTPKAENINIAFQRFVEKIQQYNLPIPIFSEKSGCLGHSKIMMPIILGKEATINNRFLIQKI